MKLTSVLNPKLIFVNLTENGRTSLYKTMLERAIQALSLEIDSNAFLADIMEREDSIKIPYENGAALPHTRSTELDDLYIIIGILTEPLQLKENDKSPTKIVIMSLISGNTSDMYLKTLAAFSKYLVHQENVDKLTSSNSAENLLQILEDDDVVLKKNITAEDIMVSQFDYVGHDAPLTKALDIITRESRLHLPVLDAEGRLEGVLNASSIIHKSIPPYMLMMDNLKFINSFEPFEKILSEEEKMFVSDFISEPEIVINADTPLIQFTVPLAKEKTAHAYVVDENRKLLGIISMQDIITKVLRG